MLMMRSVSVKVFLLVWSVSQAIQIDNGLIGEPSVDCQDSQVSLTFRTRKPFIGRVYVKGMADHNRCSRDFATNLDQTQFSMLVGQEDCNMGKRRMTDGSLEGMMFSLIVVVSFHGTFVTKADRAFRCMCFFRNIKQVTNLLDMSMLGTTDLMDAGPMPTCTYTIHFGSVSGPTVRYASVGDKIFHVWQCDDPTQGFLIHSCGVTDGRGNRFDLIDIDGCAIDPIIQPDLKYSEDYREAYVETHGYKFSDTSVLDYTCVLELCKLVTGECNRFTPPVCGRGKRSVNHEISNQESPDLFTFRAGKMDVTAGINVIDTLLEDFASGKQALMESLNSVENVRKRPAESDDVTCVSSPTFGLIITFNIILLTLTVVCGRLLYQPTEHVN